MTAAPCPDCSTAAQVPHFVFRAGCTDCAARQIARGPDFHRCRTAGKQDRQYRALLARVGVTHEQVVKAAEADKERAPA